MVFIYPTFAVLLYHYKITFQKKGKKKCQVLARSSKY